MMDIVERLREDAKFSREKLGMPAARLLSDEAADEIERLRAIADRADVGAENLFEELWSEAEQDCTGYRNALEEIVNPLKFMRQRAEAEGMRLSGMAYEIANSVSHLQGIAKAALAVGADVRASETGAEKTVDTSID